MTADRLPLHPKLSVRVHAVRAEALDVLSLELRPRVGETLPSFTAGSHIDVELPIARSQKIIRQYSLSNDSSERHRYVIGVGRDVASRGGSTHIHDHVRPGDELLVSAPRNNFALDEASSNNVLIAGGIGITPVLAMVRRLCALQKPWTLYYCVRSPVRAAFLDTLWSLADASSSLGRVVTVYDGIPGTARLDLQELVRAAPAGTDFYCCGPVSMLKAFSEATAACDDSRVHVEWFSAPAAPPAVSQDHRCGNGAFTVRLKRKNREFAVPADKTILEVLLDGGVDVDYSCREGLCGTCETRVLAGVPDHRDPMFAGKKDPPLDKIMVCVSRCTSDELVLDL